MAAWAAVAWAAAAWAAWISDPHAQQSAIRTPGDTPGFFHSDRLTACRVLNAAENIWQYLRQTYLSNRVFPAYTTILDACQDAWRRLLAETGRIASIATRQWAIIGQTL